MAKYIKTIEANAVTHCFVFNGKEYSYKMTQQEDGTWLGNNTVFSDQVAKDYPNEDELIELLEGQSLDYDEDETIDILEYINYIEERLMKN